MPLADGTQDDDYVIETKWAGARNQFKIGMVDNDAEMRFEWIRTAGRGDSRTLKALETYLTRSEVEELVTVLTYRLRQEWITSTEARRRGVR